MTCIMEFVLWVDLIHAKFLNFFPILPFLFGRGQVILTALEQSPQMVPVLAPENVISKLLGVFCLCLVWMIYLLVFSHF